MAATTPDDGRGSAGPARALALDPRDLATLARLVILDEKTRQYLPPRSRGGHVRDLLLALEGAYAAGRTDPGRALGQVSELAERRSLVVLFTDLLDAPPTLADRLRLLRTHGHDVVLFHLLDPDEIELPFADLTQFEGM